MGSLTSRDLTLAGLWSLGVMALTCGPYVQGRLLAGDRYFSGLVAAVDEGNVYLQWIRQASEGRWTLSNQYTTEPQKGLWFNVYLLGVGRAAGLLHLTPPQAFHGARIISGWLCLMSFFLLAAATTPDRAVRWVALTLVSLGSGFGGLLELLSPDMAQALTPVDYGPRWVAQPEAITFLSLLINPLFAFSMALICLVLLCALRGVETGRLGWTAGAGLLLLLLGNVHTYDIVAVHLALIAWLAIGVVRREWPWQRAAGNYAVILALSIASPLWQVYVMQADPAYGAKANTPTLAAPPWSYVLGYGLPWLLALAGTVWALLGRSADRGRFAYVVAWLIVAHAVVYTPVPSQRKMAEGMHFPICLLAAAAIAKVFGGWVARRTDSGRAVGTRLALATAVVVLLALPSNVMYYADCLQAVRTNNAGLLHALMPPIYLQPGEMAAVRELQAVGSERDVAMCSSMLGSHVGALTKCHVVAGHWAETLHLAPQPGGPPRRLAFEEYALPAVSMFYGVRTSAQAKARILLRFGVTYVIAGPLEDALAAVSAPPGRTSVRAEAELAALPFLTHIDTVDGVALFAVCQGELLRAAVSQPRDDLEGAE